MRALFGSLLFRISALVLTGLVALLLTIFLAVSWPDGRPMMFRMVDPQDAREIAETLEAAPQALRPAIAAAASHGGTSVTLLDGFPDEREAAADGRRPAPRLEERFRLYADALDGRCIHVQVRNGTLFARPLRADEPPRGPVRALVGLSTGEVIAIERAPRALQTLADRAVIVGAVAALVLLVILFTLLWQVVRPMARLAQATQAFQHDIAAPDARPSGAREVRTLASAFNAMKAQISGLVSERTRMLAAIAHDLRTYLTRLRLRADLIPDDRQRNRAIGDIEDMGKLLDDILLFARTDAGAEPAPPVIDARAEAAAYVDLRREAGDAVSLSAPDTPLPCCCAPLAFRRILGNLIDNAVRYGTQAQVALRVEGSMTTLVVTDDGPGAPDAVIDRLTGAFERVEASRGRHSGGAGLGLAIVKALAESHGGTLAIENELAGGLRVTVRLPNGDPQPN
ncbi:MAG: HAMP domain-containing protein [Alphaproteobacteria bacterium]|nr:HAMP domain-containing protein [Alphaproteobacteria bacterium]MBU0793922.1 HAMP domain-containing protein [Alphaproteobacteria bacterium]MBU0875832.1 HAMP domain-containing protein [Alphaproteobacteria bacterium]MBU1769988.1 HAMP domain-containing protein [Alphaproteobacteria bacterium]